MLRRLAVLALVLLPVMANAEVIRYVPPAGGVSVGSFSANCITKAATATTLTCALLSDDGTNATLGSGYLKLPSGSAAAPSLRYGTNGGFYDVVAGNPGVSANGSLAMYWGGGHTYAYQDIVPNGTGTLTSGLAGNRWSVGYFGGAAGGGVNLGGANGETMVHAFLMESITLSTSGTTTDSSANLLPANSIINSVVCRVTTTITTATDWSVGDATVAARFSAANATRAAGTTSVGLDQRNPANADNAGPVQTAAAKLRITTTGTPGAGVIRCTVFYTQFTAPTS